MFLTIQMTFSQQKVVMCLGHWLVFAFLCVLKMHLGWVFFGGGVLGTAGTFTLAWSNFLQIKFLASRNYIHIPSIRDLTCLCV